jgi:long-chain acyl-CoA synthetase
LPAPTLRLPWERVLDVDPLEARCGDYPAAIYDPDSILALIYTSGTTGRPKGVALTHAAALANVDHVNYWLPYREGGVYLHAAPLFHIADFHSCLPRRPSVLAGHDSEVQPRAFCETSRNASARPPWCRQ